MGTGTGLIAGGGIAGTLAALPMPLGSLTEPLSPRAFPGPGAMPLTPASWASARPGVARRPRSATLMTAALPSIHPREKIETSCARFMGGDPWPSCFVHGMNLEGGAKVPMMSPGSLGGVLVRRSRAPRSVRPPVALSGCALRAIC